MPCVSPELVLGTAQFEKSYGIVRKTAGDFDACQLLEIATSLGVNSLDTAPGYGNAQEIIGSCGWPGLIHTKIPDETKALESLESSLFLLRRASVDVAYFHQPRVLQKDHFYFERIHSLVVPSLVKQLGVSIYLPDEFDAALENPFLSVIQTPLNIIDHRINNVQLNAAAQMEKKVYARSVFLQGALLQSPNSLPPFLSDLRPVIEKLDAIERNTGITRIEILIQSLLARPGISGLIAGAESPSQLLKIAGAFNATIATNEPLRATQSLKIDDPRIIDPRCWPIG